MTEYAPAHAPAVVASEDESVNADPQASEAVAAAKDGVAAHSMVDAAGSAAITGAVLSSTLMVCEAVDELPHASVAVHVLVTE